MLKKTISGLLRKIDEQLNSGNCNMSEDELLEIAKHLNTITSPLISKYSACKYMNMSRAKFDSLLKEGKLPKGIKQQGFKELFWNKNELKEALNNLKK